MQVRTNPEKRLVIWNKLTNLRTATEPPIGGDWEESGTTTYGAGQFGTAFSNTGLNNRIRRLDKFSDTGFKLERGTIDLWSQWNAFVSEKFIVDLSSNSQTNFLLQILIQSDGKIFFSVGKSGSSTSTTSSVLSTATWYHIVCQWDTAGIESGSNILRIYINGSLDGTSDTAISVDNASASESFHIGSSRLNADDIDGFIDNLKVYNFVNIDARSNITEGDRDITGTNIQINKNKLLVSWQGFNDDGGKANIGTDYTEFGTVVYSAGKFGTGYDNTGGGDNYLISDVFWDDAGVTIEQGTVEKWFQINDQTPAANYVLLHMFGAGNQGVFIQVLTSGSLRILINRGDVAPSPDVLYALSNLTINTWYHLGMVWDSAGIDGTTDTLRMYIDNVDVGSTTEALGTNTASAASGIQISRFSTSSGFSWQSKIDNFKIYNYAKTNFDSFQSEGIDSISNLHFNPDEKLTGWNKLNDASGQSVIGEDITYTGAPSFVACKYKQGPDIDTNGKYADMSHVPGQKGTVEIWIKPHFNFEGVADAYFIDADSTGVRASLFFDSSEDDFSFGLFEGGTGYVVTSTGIVFSIDDVIHLAGVWDTDGIQGTTDRTRLYVNGVLEASSTGAIATITQTGIRLGNRNALDLNADSVIEDFKISNYAITEFKDRDQQEIMDVSKNPEHYLKGIY